MIFSCLGFAWLWFHAKWITFVFLVQWYPSLPQRKHNVKRINILVLCILLRFFSIINAEIGLITYFRIYENCIESGLHADSLLFTQSWKSPNVWSNLHRVKHIYLFSFRLFIRNNILCIAWLNIVHFMFINRQILYLYFFPYRRLLWRFQHVTTVLEFFHSTVFLVSFVNARLNSKWYQNEALSARNV